MSDYYNVTTNNGDAAITAAIANNTKLNITHVAFGDGNGAVPTPSKTRTTLVNEVHRQAITKYSIHPTVSNWLIVEAIIPSDVGGFWIREIGLIADGILISHGSHSPFYKVAETNGVSEFRLKYTINIQDGGVVDLTLDESLIYATQAWIDENYVPRDAIVDNLTTDDATKPLSAKQGKDLQDNKIAKDELVNNLTSGGTDKALTAEQGKVLLNMFASNLNSSGYQKIANPSDPLKPLIIQWGEIPSQAMTNSQTGRQTFNVSFPNSCFNVFISSTAGVTGENNNSEGFQKTSSDQSGFYWLSQWAYRNSATNTNAAISFFAVGN